MSTSPTTLAYALAVLIGVIAGLRAMTAPAAIAWAVAFGRLGVAGTPLAFFGYAHSRIILTVLAAFELVSDQLPKTPSRKVPIQFGTRILTGAACGGAILAGFDALPIGIACGAVGAIIGTLGGAAFRAKLAAAFGRDLPAALIEDAIAIGGAALIVFSL